MWSEVTVDALARKIVLNNFGFRITKTYLYSFDPSNPHFYIVKLGFTGYTFFFLFLLKSIDCGFSLEPPRFWRVPTIYILSRNMKNIRILSENFQFLVVEFSIYSELSLQRQHLFPKTLPLKWICRCTEYLMSRRMCKKGIVLFLFPYRTYVLDIC